MPVYNVIRKSDGQEITRYCSAVIHEELNGAAYPLTDFDHVEYVEGAVPPAPTSRVMTKLEYLRRFTVEERVAIRAAAPQNAVLLDYLQLMELAQDINTGDSDTIAAVTMLEQSGLIAAGRANEVLNG